MVTIVRKSSKDDDKTLLSIITNILNSNKLASMSTVDKQLQPWINTFFFNFDEDLNIYFITSPKTRHSQNIKQHNKVAINVFDSHQKPSDNKKGVFIQGECFQVTEPKEILKGLTIYTSRFEIEKDKLQELPQLALNSRFYKVVPNYIKLFTETDTDEKFTDIFLK